MFSRPAPIDLSTARAYSLDLDLDDEEALSTERRALGGDAEARRKHQFASPSASSSSHGPREGKPFLLSNRGDSDDSDDDDGNNEVRM